MTYSAGRNETEFDFALMGKDQVSEENKNDSKTAAWTGKGRC